MPPTNLNPTPIQANPRTRVLLIVDDDAGVLSSLQALLAAKLPTVRVLTATSGTKAMTLVRANPLDMILSGFRMDKMDGVEFLRRARIVQADIPMIIMTAHASSRMASEALRIAGVKSVVTKPIDAERLVALLRPVLEGVAPALPQASLQGESRVAAT